MQLGCQLPPYVQFEMNRIPKLDEHVRSTNIKSNVVISIKSNDILGVTAAYLNLQKKREREIQNYTVYATLLLWVLRIVLGLVVFSL